MVVFRRGRLEHRQETSFERNKRGPQTFTERPGRERREQRASEHQNGE